MFTLFIYITKTKTSKINKKQFLTSILLRSLKKTTKIKRETQNSLNQKSTYQNDRHLDKFPIRKLYTKNKDKEKTIKKNKPDFQKKTTRTF